LSNSNDESISSKEYIQFCAIVLCAYVIHRRFGMVAIVWNGGNDSTVFSSCRERQQQLRDQEFYLDISWLAQEGFLSDADWQSLPAEVRQLQVATKE
jgi:hypothetical protein